MKTGLRPAALVGLCLLVTWLVNASYNLGYFYTTGAAVYDAGWFAWLSLHAHAWPMPNPAAMGGDFLSIHMSVGFFLTSLILSPLAALPDAVVFSALAATWAPLLFLALFLLLDRRSDGSASTLPQRCAGAMLLTFNGMMLSMLGFPHIEIFIPVLGLLAIVLALRADGWVWWASAGIAFLLALSIREDAGLHLALPLLAMTIVAARGGNTAQRRRCMILAVLALCGAAAALAAQRLLVPTGGRALGHVYLGHPALAHLSVASVARRLGYWATRRAYIFVPLLCLLAATRAERRYAWGILIALPWLGLSLIAATQPAGDLWDYYCFPLVFVLVWPLLLARATAEPARLPLQMAMGAASTGLFVIVGLLPFVGDGGSHDRAPWAHLLPPSIAQIRATELALHGTDDAVLDDGTASLALNHTEPWQHRLGLQFSDADFTKARRFIAFNRHPAYLTERIADLNKVFPNCAAVPYTDLVTCSR